MDLALENSPTIQDFPGVLETTCGEYHFQVHILKSILLSSFMLIFCKKHFGHEGRAPIWLVDDGINEITGI